MKVVIAGAGEVGFHVINMVSREGVDVVAIDNKQARVKLIEKCFDTVDCILGNAVDEVVLGNILKDDTDLFIAITDSDEANILACMLAEEYNVTSKIARVNSADAGDRLSQYVQEIDQVINPYQIISKHVENLLKHPFVTDFAAFMGNELYLFQLRIDSHSPIKGLSVLEYGRQKEHLPALIAIIQSGNKIRIPQASEIICEGDHLYFFCARQKFDLFCENMNMKKRNIKRIMINGGGKCGYAIARRLENNYDIRILEQSLQRCGALSELLDDSIILHADGSHSSILETEDVRSFDAFISVTNDDSINIIASTQARHLGAKKTISLINQFETIPIILKSCCVDSLFSPRLLSTRSILKRSRGINIQSYFSFPASNIELLEIIVEKELPINGKPIKDLILPRGVLIGSIKRGDKIFVPHGDSQIMTEDVILLLQHRQHRRFSRATFISEGKS